MKKLFLFIFLVCLTCIFALGQNRVFDVCHGYCSTIPIFPEGKAITNADDENGTVFISSDRGIGKFDSLGIELWHRVLTDSLGVITISNINDTTISFTLHELNDVVTILTNGYLVIGKLQIDTTVTDSLGAQLYSSFGEYDIIIRISSQGDVMWGRVFENPIFNSPILLFNSLSSILIFERSNTFYNPFVLIDTSGNVKWYKRMYGFDQVTTGTNTSNGCFVLSARSISGPILFKLDTLGNIIFSNAYDTLLQSYINSIAEFKEFIVFSLVAYNPTTPKSTLYYTDALGQILFTKEIIIDTTTTNFRLLNWKNEYINLLVNKKHLISTPVGSTDKERFYTLTFDSTATFSGYFFSTSTYSYFNSNSSSNESVSKVIMNEQGMLFMKNVNGSLFTGGTWFDFSICQVDSQGAGCENDTLTINPIINQVVTNTFAFSITDSSFTLDLNAHSIVTNSISHASIVNCSGFVGLLAFFQKEAKISIYPNPSSEQIFINYNSDLNRTLNLSFFNLSGQKVKSKNYQSGSSISVEDLPEGFYLLELSDKSETYRGKLLIQR